MPDMHALLAADGFPLLAKLDSSAESLAWFESVAARLKESGPAPVSFGLFLGADFPLMASNQVANLREKAIRTATFVFEA